MDKKEINFMGIELLKHIYINSWSFDFRKFKDFFHRLDNSYDLSKIKIIILCGSSRFKFQIDLIEKSLVILGFTVFNYPYFHSEYGRLDGKQKKELEGVLDLNHKRKIDLSDLVIIINFDKYIGKSVSEELKYCKSIKKEIIYYEV